MRVLRRVMGLGLALLAGFAPWPGGSASAQPRFPDRPLHIIVPVAAGGLGDQAARQVGQRLAADLGQPVVVENRPGASFVIGTQAVARAAPDGHTLLLSTTTNLVLNGLLRRNMPYDAERDLTVLSVLMETPFVLVVNARMPVTTLQEYVAEARRTGRVTYSSAGVGSANHLPGELLSLMAGVEFTHVPYNGGAPSLTAAISGDVNSVYDTVPTALPFIADGRLRALGVTTSQRVTSLPDVPTIAEAGFPGFASASWIGISIPSATPAPIADRLKASLDGVLQDEAFRNRFLAAGMLIQPRRSLAETAAYVQADRDRWARVVRERRITVE
jgi:tripartite-type tricarboxylate transporter receptor subunit TctC